MPKGGAHIRAPGKKAPSSGGVRPKSPGVGAEGWGTSTSPGQARPPAREKGVRPKAPGLDAEGWGTSTSPGQEGPKLFSKGVGPKSPGLDAKGWGFYPSPGQGRPNGSNPPDLSHDPWAGSNRGGPKVGACTQRATMCAQGGGRYKIRTV